jgi:hypothetical protein
MKSRSAQYHRQPVRILTRLPNGKTRSRLSGYGAIARAKAAGTLIGAWSTSTGRSIA